VETRAVPGQPHLRGFEWCRTGDQQGQNEIRVAAHQRLRDKAAQREPDDVRPAAVPRARVYQRGDCVSGRVDCEERLS